MPLLKKAALPRAESWPPSFQINKPILFHRLIKRTFYGIKCWPKKNVCAFSQAIPMAARFVIWFLVLGIWCLALGAWYLPAVGRFGACGETNRLKLHGQIKIQKLQQHFPIFYIDNPLFDFNAAIILKLFEASSQTFRGSTNNIR